MHAGSNSIFYIPSSLIFFSVINIHIFISQLLFCNKHTALFFFTATLNCSRFDCPLKYHVPCALENQGTSLSCFFHAKMVKFDDENKIRPGQFFVCDQHIEWNDEWNELQQIVKTPALLQHGPSIDVDDLPLNVRILVSTASGLSIFDPLSPKNQPPGI